MAAVMAQMLPFSRASPQKLLSEPTRKLARGLTLACVNVKTGGNAVIAAGDFSAKK